MLARGLRGGAKIRHRLWLVVCYIVIDFNLLKLKKLSSRLTTRE